MFFRLSTHTITVRSYLIPFLRIQQNKLNTSSTYTITQPLHVYLIRCLCPPLNTETQPQDLFPSPLRYTPAKQFHSQSISNT